jgi:hypothetical protein
MVSPDFMVYSRAVGVGDGRGVGEIFGTEVEVFVGVDVGARVFVAGTLV